MSIVSIRESMEKKGCQVVLWIIGLLIVLGMVANTFKWNNPEGEQDPAQMVELYKVGDTSVTAAMFDDDFRKAAESMGGTSTGSPATDFGLYGQAIKRRVNLAAVERLAAERGIVMDEATIKTLAETTAKQVLDQQKLQLLMSGQIKPDATEADADKKLVELLGKPKEQFVTEKVQEIVAKLNDPKEKKDIIDGLRPLAVLQSITKSLNFSEDDLKKTFEQMQFEIARFDDPTKGPTDREAAAAKALEAIKGGKSFAEVQKEASPKSKPENLKSELTRAMIEADKSLAPLLALKPGEVSEVITSFGSPTIYKLVGTKANLPQDFEKNKARLLANAKDQKAATQLTADLEAKTKTLKVEFKDLGIKAVYDTYELLTNQEARKDAKAFRESVIAMRTTVTGMDATKGSANLAALSEFVLTEELYASGTVEQRKEMLPERLEVAERVLQFGEDLSLRLDLSKDLIGAKMGEEAFSVLLVAAENNVDTENAGTAVHTQISQMNEAAFNQKVFTDDQHTQIQKELDRWVDEKATRIKEEAEDKAAAAKANADLDAEVEKAKQEKASQEKSGTKPAPAGTTGTTGTTGK